MRVKAVTYIKVTPDQMGSPTVITKYKVHEFNIIFSSSPNCPLSVKAQPQAAMLHICDGVFQNSCDAGKMPAMVCDAFSNMLVILLPILKYLSYFLSDFQTIFSKMKEM